MDFAALEHIPSRWFTRTNGRAIDLVVLHTVEGDPDTAAPGDIAAENVARYCARRPEKVSAHLFIDDDSIVRGVLDKDVAYAAPKANHNGIQIEQCGYARWTRDQWLNDHLGTLCLTARTLVHYYRRHSIPIAFVDADGLRRGHRGVTTHHEVTKAWGKSNHTDPGPGYPLHDVIALAWQILLSEPAAV